MLNVKFYRKQKTLNESLQASGQALLLEGLVDDVLNPLLKKYKDSADDFEVLQDLGEWPEITPGPKKPNVKALSGPEKAEAFKEYNRLSNETKEKNKPKQEEIDRKVKLIKWANLMYGEGPKDHPPSEALPEVQKFLDKLQTMRDKYKSNEDFKKKVDELSSGTSNDPFDINQFTSDDMREIIEAIEVQAGDIVPDKEQARKQRNPCRHRQPSQRGRGSVSVQKSGNLRPPHGEDYTERESQERDPERQARGQGELQEGRAQDSEPA